jgi:hypothetical protein
LISRRNFLGLLCFLGGRRKRVLRVFALGSPVAVLPPLVAQAAVGVIRRIEITDQVDEHGDRTGEPAVTYFARPLRDGTAGYMSSNQWEGNRQYAPVSATKYWEVELWP